MWKMVVNLHDFEAYNFILVFDLEPLDIKNDKSVGKNQ